MIPTQADSGFRSLGQPTARTIALRADRAGRLLRTYLVHGPAGADKGAFVDDLLALAFCSAPPDAARPCNACRGCRDARSRAHPDLLVGSPGRWRDDRSSGESIVAAARRWLLDASGTPVAGERRVIVVEDLDAAGEQVQNALLKALEEPGERHMFVLVADQPGNVLPTIRSRAQPLRIGAVDHEALTAWLMDRERLPADQAAALARIAGGLSGTAIGYARTPELVAWRRRVQQELLAALGSGRASRFGTVRDLIDEAARLAPGLPTEVAVDDEAGEAQRPAAGQQRRGAALVATAWSDLARDLLVAGAGRPELAPGAELLDGLAATALRIDRHALIDFARLLERVRDGLAENASPRLALEVAMLGWPTLVEPGGR